MRSRLGQAARGVDRAQAHRGLGDAGALDVMGLGYATPIWRCFAGRRDGPLRPCRPSRGRGLAGDRRGAGLPGRRGGAAFSQRALRPDSGHPRPGRGGEPAGLMREVWACWRRRPGDRGGGQSPRRLVQCRIDAARPWRALHPRPARTAGARRPAGAGGLSRALFAPPLQWTAGWADGFEQAGQRLWPAFSGLIMLEAVKQTFAVKPKAAAPRPGCSFQACWPRNRPARRRFPGRSHAKRR